MTEPVPADIAKLSFEDAMRELETIVDKLDHGEAKLDDAVAAYERGTLLRRHCEAKLAEAKARIEKISLTESGTLKSEPAEID